MAGKIERSVSIEAPPAKIWKYLTDTSLMKKWMGDPEMNIEITTDWVVGNSIQIKGYHHVHFENNGIVLRFEPERILQYSHLSSVSHLPHTKENHSVITFTVVPLEKKTLLKVQIENFPTESIYKHLDFYWQGTLAVLKDLIER
ncbi:SRPBCC family protein [Salmonirosea aquatica]|uniref:SRPBCC domain-containing protein n=1 Tax=Salmonirosea aquatica TaxID=2654236 RepID=A0A7C9BFR1_9BACT|nr:SRPBCC domain-containing protein [Cytophagaceae bacterium SJW1-29]